MIQLEIGINELKDELLRTLRKEARSAFSEMAKTYSYVGELKAMVLSGQMSPFQSYTEACKMYGRTNIDRWTEEGLIDKIKDGKGHTKTRFDRVKLALTASGSNRISWFKHHSSKQ
ncbi:hypothetical protein FACS1894195_0620 [Bacteroidia bacterium]|nr:hypothetical protein FACS1894195_0620 [Bacteroidia bacterium]